MTLDMNSAALPDLFRNINSLVSDEVIYGVVYGGKTIEDALDDYTDQMEAAGLEEPEWLDEIDFDDIEELQEAITGTVDEAKPPVAVSPDASAKLEELAELVELTLDDPNDLDEFANLYDEVQDALENVVSDATVDELIELMDTTKDFRVVADAMNSADKDMMLQGADASNDAWKAVGAAMDAELEEMWRGEEEFGLEEVELEEEQTIEDALTAVGTLASLAATSEITDNELDGNGEEPELVKFEGTGKDDGGITDTQAAAAAKAAKAALWKSALTFWQGLDIDDQNYVSDTMNDPEMGLGDMVSTLNFLYGEGDDGWQATMLDKAPVPSTPPTLSDFAKSLWTKFFDEAEYEWSFDTEGDFATVGEWITNELGQILTGSNDPAGQAASLFGWAFNHASRDEIDETLYNLIRDVITGEGYAENSAYQRDWRLAIQDLDADHPEYIDTAMLMPTGMAVDIDDPGLDALLTWKYPTYDEAVRGYTPATTITGFEGGYLKEILGASSAQEDMFDDAWQRANPKRNKALHSTERSHLFEDANMASVIGYWEPEQERYLGYAKDPEKRYEINPFAPDADWYDDFILNSAEHRTSLYRNAVEFAEFLDAHAEYAEGEDFARVAAGETTKAEIAKRGGFDLSDDEGNRQFSQWQMFNPLLYKINTDDFDSRVDMIKQLAVSAITPVNAPPKQRKAWKGGVDRAYAAWVGGGNNPNSFLKNFLGTQGRVVSQTSHFAPTQGTMPGFDPYVRRGAMGEAGGYFDVYGRMSENRTPTFEELALGQMQFDPIVP